MTVEDLSPEPPLSRLESPFHRNQNLAVVELDDEALIYDAVTRKLHHLNPVAAFVFSILEHSMALDECVDRVARHYGTTAPQVEEETSRLIRRFLAEGLIKIAPTDTMMTTASDVSHPQ